jgi:hypothetical protein
MKTIKLIFLVTLFSFISTVHLQTSKVLLIAKREIFYQY